MTVIRWPDAHYELRKISLAGGRALVGTRSIVATPFPNKSGMIYVAGYDANKALAHKTAWIGRAVLFF